MKKLIASIAIISVLASLVSVAAFGAETTVTATVTAEVVALSITANSTINYGTVSTTADTTASGKNLSPTIRNDGSVNADFQLRGTDSASWELADAAGDATYAHKECHTNCDTTPTWAALNEDTYSSSIFTGVTPTSTRDFDLQITIPTSNAGTTQQNVNVSVQATAS